MTIQYIYRRDIVLIGKNYKNKLVFVDSRSDPELDPDPLFTQTDPEH